jgi:hypothetical protein
VLAPLQTVSHSGDIWKYKRISKACHCAVVHHLNHVETQLVANGNLGSFYKYTNRKLNGSNGIAPLRDGNGKIITSSSAD